MHKARLLVGGVAGFAALGLGGGAALAAQGNAGPQLNVQAADATQNTMPTMPVAMSNSATSGPSSNYKTSVTLHAMPQGTVTLQQQGTRLEATIAALGLTPGSTHIAQIASGDGQAPIVFSQFTASATGQVDTTISSLELVTGRLSHDATFQVELSTSPAQPIAIARVRSHGFGERVPLEAVEPSGEGRLAGHAKLDYDSRSKTLTVSVVATGFVPDTSHAAHVHMGSCAAQGAPIYMLLDLHADGRGRIHQTDVIRNLASFTAPASGWYINIHEGSSATILDAQGQPTTQFRPLLCANLTASSSATPPPSDQAQPAPAQPPASPTTAMNPPTMPMNPPSTPMNQTDTTPNTNMPPANPTTTTPNTSMPPANPTTTTPNTSMQPANPTTTMPASGGSGTTPPPQQENLAVSFIPVGTTAASGSAAVTLQPADNQICTTINLSGFTSSPAAEIEQDGSPVVNFSLNTLTPAGTFRGCAQASSPIIHEIEIIPGAYQLRVVGSGSPAQVLQGSLRPQPMHT